MRHIFTGKAVRDPNAIVGEVMEVRIKVSASVNSPASFRLSFNKRTARLHHDHRQIAQASIARRSFLRMVSPRQNGSPATDLVLLGLKSPLTGILCLFAKASLATYFVKWCVNAPF